MLQYHSVILNKNKLFVSDVGSPSSGAKLSSYDLKN
jgi:hypothetical protein